MTTPHHRVAVAIAACALLCWSAAIAIAQEVFTPWDVARLRTATSVNASPDGSLIAYVLAVPRDPFSGSDGPAWSELHVVPARGGDSRPFITGSVQVTQPQWTPDGQAISFLSTRDPDTTRSLYVIPVQGGEARRVLTYETDIVDYAWHPDGERVAFLAKPPPPEATESLRDKGFTQEIYEEDVKDTLVHIGNVQSGEKPRTLLLPGSASEALWSPDGTRLAVVLAPTPLVDDSLMQRRVHIVDPETGRVLVNLRNPGKLGALGWSPDGRRLAIVSGEDIHDPAAGRLWVSSVEGGGWTDLLPGYDGHVSDFVWRSANSIVYIGDEGVETMVGEVQPDGAGRRTIVPAGGPILTAIDGSRDGATLALRAETPRYPAEVFALLPDATAPDRLTHSNSWLADKRFAPQEVVRYRARDGLELEGILIRPLDAQPGQRYPLILTVHGGPESRFANGWLTHYSNPGQVGAAQGFAVFYPNYRGSTGRGVAFSKLSQGDPAGAEFDDLVDAVDHLVSLGLVDAEQAGITGGSYGGYATAWGSTYYTERFAAGVMFVGISDKISKVGTTDIANEEYLVHARKRPWEDWQFFLERSPIYHAAKSETPLLILHGKDDPRVNPTQSLELYRYLKLHDNAPVRLVWYPGEQHGNRRAAARLDYNLRMMRWFRHYLQGPGGAPPDPELDYERSEEAGVETTSRRD